MGSCCKTEQTRQNEILSQEILEERRQFNKIQRLLILGSNGSGKSTVFKQLKTIYGRGFQLKERHAYLPHIHKNCILEMQLALDVLDDILYSKQMLVHGYIRQMFHEIIPFDLIDIIIEFIKDLFILFQCVHIHQNADLQVYPSKL